MGAGGRARRLRGVWLSGRNGGVEVGAMMCVQDREMKQPWCLVASDGEVSTSTLIRYYAKRWGRDELSGPEGPQVRDGVGSHADIESGTAEPDAAAECPSHCVAEPAGGCGRESG